MIILNRRMKVCIGLVAIALLLAELAVAGRLLPRANAPSRERQVPVTNQAVPGARSVRTTMAAASPVSPTQQRIDRQLAAAESQALADPAALNGLPAPSDSAQYPPVSPSDRHDPTAYATSFVTELLNRDYRRQTPKELLAWAQAESAPNTLPGVPSAYADRSLAASLLLPDSPVPSLAQWPPAASGDTQSAQGIQVETDPNWLALISTGWEPADPAMTIVAVTGTLTIRANSGLKHRSFSVVLTLGSRASGPGYGAVAVDDWTVA